ncbi:MAG: transposase [Planctomycetota bacterium]|jgi:transposase|nr:transposase [Planctomycetota bacterium]
MGVFRRRIGEIAKCSGLRKFKVLPKRWIVERTFAWFMRWRCLDRRHTRKIDAAENESRTVMTRNMLRKPANAA